MRVVDSGGLYFLGSLQQLSQDDGGNVSGKLLQDVFGDSKDRPVVDLQNIFPGCQRLTLGICYVGAAYQMQGFHLLVHPRDALVEDHGVGDDGAGHAAGLGNIAHSQQPGNDRGNVRAQLGHLIQLVGSLTDALLKRVSRLLHCLLWDGDQTGEVGQVGCRTL